MGKVEKDHWNSNGVIVTVYEESATLGSHNNRNRKIRQRNLRSRKFSGGGHNRRAELLAYTHHLRSLGHQQDPTPTNQTPKSKKSRRSVAPLQKLQRSVGRLFGRRKRGWRYERIRTEEDDEKSGLCRPAKNTWSKMSKRIRSFLKGLSSSWKCNKK